MERQTPDDGSDTEKISVRHKTDDNNDKPTVSSGSGKTGFKDRQPFFNKFQHGRHLL